MSFDPANAGGGRNADVEPDVVSEIDSYEDIISQTLHWDEKLDMDAGHGSDLSDNGKGGGIAFEMTPLNDRLGPNQVAELVALDPAFHDLRLDESPDVGTTPGTARLETEITCHSYNEEVDLAVGGSGGTATDTLKGDLDGEEDSLFEQFTYTEVGRQSVWFGVANLYTAFNDTTAGTGGGGNIAPGANLEPIYFRDRYGRGPMFEHDETLNVSWGVEWTEISNQQLWFGGRWYAYWDVYTRDTGPLREDNVTF